MSKRKKLPPLTRAQRVLLTWITDWIRLEGYPPSFREMCAGLDYKSPNSITGLLNGLEARGRIRRVPDAARTIVVISTEGIDDTA